MRYIVINLSGVFNASLAEKLKENVLDILQESSVILLDFSKVESIEQSSLLDLVSVIKTIHKSGSDRLAFSNISNFIYESISSRVSFEIPCFESKERAKSYLEEKNQTRPQEILGLHTQYVQVLDFTKKGDIYYIFCPGCSVKLRIRSIGNHACPACKTRFLFKPDIEDHPVEATHYETISLD